MPLGTIIIFKSNNKNWKCALMLNIEICFKISKKIIIVSGNLPFFPLDKFFWTMASVLEQYVNTVQNLSSQGMFLYTKDVLARDIIMMIVLF